MVLIVRIYNSGTKISKIEMEINKELDLLNFQPIPKKFLLADFIIQLFACYKTKKILFNDSPIWDDALARVKITKMPEFQRLDIKAASSSERPSDESDNV